MQLIYYIRDPFETYVDQVNNQTWHFPDYSESCPICGGKQCAVRNGFYYRQKVIAGSAIFYDLPIPRWLCRRKGTKNTRHRTFSLLPHFLVPRYQHDLSTILDTLCHQNQLPKPSFVQTKNHISAQGVNDDIPLENGPIHRFRKLFEQAFYKLFSVPELKSIFDIENIANDPARKILHIIEFYSSPLLTTTSMKTSNIEKLAWDFVFNYQTGPFFGRHFLFGTPAQKQV